MEPIKNFRNVYSAIVIEVFEGRGIESDPSRIERYVYNPDTGETLGKIDQFPQ